MTAPTRAAVRATVTELFVGVAACLAGVVVIDRWAAPTMPATTRLLLTAGYFAALLGLAYLLLGPRRRAVAAVVEWMYDDAPPHTHQAARRWAHAVDQLATTGVGLAAALVGATAVRVFAVWYPALDSLAGLAWYVWWLAAVGLLLLPLSGGFLFQGVFQQFRELRERDALSVGYQPRAWAELFAVAEPAAPVPLTVGDGLTFAAGGRTWSWAELRTNCVVFGQVGSGKTSCVLNTMLDGLLGSAHRAGLPPGGLILDPKGDYGDKLHALLARYGWADRLRVIDPSQPFHGERWNPLDSPDDELELSARLAAVMDAARDRKDGGADGFWVTEAQKFVRHAIALVRGTNDGEPPALTDILRLASSFDAIDDRVQRLNVRTAADRAALDYFADEWMPKAEDTRSGVQAYVSNLLDPFTADPYRTLFAGRSTVRAADALRDGYLVYLRMPVAEKESMARVVGTFLKLEFYREVLKAVNKARPSLFVRDEFQVFLTTGQGKGDAEFFERNRQSNHVNLVATHNLPGLSRSTPNTKEPALSLLGNCGTKVFLRNGDADTNKYAAELFGQEVVTGGGRGTAAGGGRVGLLAVSTTATDQYDQVVRPERFARLAAPDSLAPGVGYCEAVVG